MKIPVVRNTCFVLAAIGALSLGACQTTDPMDAPEPAPAVDESMTEPAHAPPAEEPMTEPTEEVPATTP